MAKKASGRKGAANTEDNRRQHPRVPLAMLVQLRSDSIDAFRAEHAVNLSVGGMFIKSTTPRPVGTQVFFQFTVKDGGTLIEGEGKVVHATAAGADPMGMGVEFTSVLEPSRSIIRALVEARLGA